MPNVIQDKDYYRKYREANRDRIREISNACYHRNKKNHRESLCAWYFKNRERLRSKSKLNNQKRRLEILGMIGLECKACGYSKDWRALQIDHVNSNGTKERKLMSHGWAYKFWKKALVERPQDYQVLCANCNFIKRYEKDELRRK